MTFCYAPWSNLEILPHGEILPCCKFQSVHYGEIYNIQHHNIDQFRQSRMLQTIKQEFTQGQWPKGCERCRIEEQNGVPSKRQLDYQRWQNHYDKYNLDSNNLLTVSMAFGNTCNLKCIICNPYASSKWAKEYQDIYSIQVPSINDLRLKAINNIATMAPDLVHLDIHGGEPFLSSIEQHHALLDHYIESGHAKNISIHYTTNGLIFPGTDWTKRWDHFKEIDIQISIDGIEKRYEYLRYPADWSILNHNIEQFLQFRDQHSNIKLSVSHTVSAFNIYYVDEFWNWCRRRGLPEPWMGRLSRPPYLRLSVWPDPAKSFVVSKLQSSAVGPVQAWANVIQNTDDTELWSRFQQFVQQHDQYRGTDFGATFPEMAQFF